MREISVRSASKVGIVAVAVIVALSVGIIKLNRSILEPSYHIRAKFASANGIDRGTPVVLAGVAVGSVSSLYLHGNSVIADLSIRNGTVLPEHTDAAIQVETLLGVMQVSLIPQGGWSHPLKPGAVIRDTSVPVEIYQLQNTAGAFFSKSDAIALNQLVSKLSTITAGKQQEVAQIINGLNQITGVINARKTQVSELIDAANVLATTVANHDQQLVSAIDNLQTVLGGLSKESLYVKYLIDNTDQVATQVGDVIGHNQPQLQSLLNNLHSVLQVVSTHQVDLAEAISYLDSAITGFASVGKSGNVSVPWANQFLNVSSSLGIDTVLGNCGLMSQALNDILGPDPLPCNQGMGPLPTPSSGASTSSLGDSPIKSSNISGADTSANPIANLLSSVSGGN